MHSKLLTGVQIQYKRPSENHVSIQANTTNARVLPNITLYFTLNFVKLLLHLVDKSMIFKPSSDTILLQLSSALTKIKKLFRCNYYCFTCINGYAKPNILTFAKQNKKESNVQNILIFKFFKICSNKKLATYFRSNILLEKILQLNVWIERCKEYAA